ncbi:PaaI family thioesterase [Niallia sp. Krafla_26]|uniref:PaaI family thioesterase n=1 Tax=Niallia sp. Krafla_26 TaxID=3064703 RepID=UPI003D169BE9
MDKQLATETIQNSIRMKGMILNLIDLHKVISGEITPPECDKMLGITLLEAKEGKAVGIWNIEEHLLNANGIVIGGFITAAIDIMMSYAITTLINEDQTHSSINIATTFHKPLHTGQVTIEAKVQKFGSFISYLSATMTQDEEKSVEALSIMGILKNPTRTNK